MAGVYETHLHARKEIVGPIIRHRVELSHRPVRVLTRVERLDERLAGFTFLVEVLGVFLLNFAGIGHHDRGEVARRGRAVDGAVKALPDEVGQVAAVIDVRVAQDEGIYLSGAEWKMAVALARLVAFALVEAAVEQHTAAGGLDQVHRAGNRAGGAPESDREWCSHRLNADEDSLPIHPDASQPKHKDDRRVSGDRAEHRIEKLMVEIGAVEQALAKMGLQRLPRPVVNQLVHAVNGNRIHAHHGEHKGPFLPADQVDDEKESREYEECPAAAVNRPGRRPDALDDRAERPFLRPIRRRADAETLQPFHQAVRPNSVVTRHAYEQAIEAGEKQEHELLRTRTAAQEQFRGHQPEEQRGHRGYEIKRLVAAFVEFENIPDPCFLARSITPLREQVQEPLVEPTGEVRVLVPM